MYASNPSEAVRYDFTVFKSPRTGTTPRAPSASAACGARTSAVTWWPPRKSASSTAEPMYPVAPVKKMRMPPHHNSSMRRNTLLDFFEDFARERGDFLVYEDGYRARSYTCLLYTSDAADERSSVDLG